MKTMMMQQMRTDKITRVRFQMLCWSLLDSHCFFRIPTTNLSYRFPILKLPPPPCAVLLVFNSNLSMSSLGFSLSALGRDDALHLFLQGQDLGVSPCGGMAGEESLASLPGDCRAKQSPMWPDEQRSKPLLVDDYSGLMWIILPNILGLIITQ